MNDILINPFTSDTQFKTFPDLESKIQSYYDRVFDSAVEYEVSPRFITDSGLKIGFRDLFYYIDVLYSNKPTSVIDVGCGECIWKRWFPNIIGFDPITNEFSQQDFVDYFDQDFSKGHQENWHNGMAINSLHFIDWKDIEQQIHLAMNIVQSRFLFTFNFAKFSNVPKLPPIDTIVAFCRKLKNTGYKIILFDAPVMRGVPLIKVEHWAYTNGTVRFILDKE